MTFGFLTFASGHAEAEEVGLAALALQTGHAGLTLALSRDDVTLAVGGANGIAVTPVERKGANTDDQRPSFKTLCS